MERAWYRNGLSCTCKFSQLSPLLALHTHALSSVRARENVAVFFLWLAYYSETFFATTITSNGFWDRTDTDSSISISTVGVQMLASFSKIE